MMNNSSASGGKVTDNIVIDVLDKMSATDWNQLLDVVKFKTTDIANTVARIC